MWRHLPVDGGGGGKAVLASYTKVGIEVDALASRLQDEGAISFVKSWNDLLSCSQSKSAASPEGSGR